MIIQIKWTSRKCQVIRNDWNNFVIDKYFQVNVFWKKISKFLKRKILKLFYNVFIKNYFLIKNHIVLKKIIK